MPRTDIVSVYYSKGGSDTLSLVIPKKGRPVGANIKAGDKYQAIIEDGGRVIKYRRVADSSPV